MWFDQYDGKPHPMSLLVGFSVFHCCLQMSDGLRGHSSRAEHVEPSIKHTIILVEPEVPTSLVHHVHVDSANAILLETLINCL